MARIVLATIGSLGDLHPFIAIGFALRRRGHDVTLAVPADHVARVEALGLAAVAIQPPLATIRAALGLDAQGFAERALRDPHFLFGRLLVPAGRDALAPLDRIAAEADAIVAAPFVFAAGWVAEKHRLPLVSVVLQPMTLFSRHDPPRAPGFGGFVGPAAGPVAQAWNALGYRTIRRLLRLRHGRTLNRFRAAHGLPPSREVPLFAAARCAAVTLCCYSPAFAPLPDDAPPGAVATGFAAFDGGASLLPALRAFLRAGPPPLVFTLGSFAVDAPGGFYAAARGMAATLGRRAVLLTGEAATDVQEGDLFTCGYAPHSRLFPHAAAIVHHGGAGTTGQALRAGRPQLVVPHMGDQHDNGARIARLGLGRVVSPKAFATQGAQALAALLGDAALADRAAAMARRVAAEGGADAAAAAIESVL